MVNDNNLIWIDLEMTGLDSVNDMIIEIATIVTDPHLNILEEGPVYAIHQSDAALDGMDEWNTTHHGSSGLTERVKQSRVTEAQAEADTIAFLQKWVSKGKSPMCGKFDQAPGIAERIAAGRKTKPSSSHRESSSGATERGAK